VTARIAPVVWRMLLASALASATGCFQYAHIPVSALQPGMDVRAQLSGVGAERLRRGGEAQARVVQGFTLNGVVLGLRGDSVLFSVPLTLYEGDYRARTLTQEVLLAREEMAGAEIRQLSRSRTTLAVVGAGAAAIAGIIALTRGAGASGGIPVNGGPGEIRLPVRIGWSVP
jgi:hypothetical protein